MFQATRATFCRLLTRPSRYHRDAGLGWSLSCPFECFRTWCDKTNVKKEPCGVSCQQALAKLAVSPPPPVCAKLTTSTSLWILTLMWCNTKCARYADDFFLSIRELQRELIMLACSFGNKQCHRQAVAHISDWISSNKNRYKHTGSTSVYFMILRTSMWAFWGIYGKKFYILIFRFTTELMNTKMNFWK